MWTSTTLNVSALLTSEKDDDVHRKNRHKDELWVVHDYREQLSAYFRPTENMKKACRHISCTTTRHELHSTFTLLSYIALVSLTCICQRENVNMSEYKPFKPCYNRRLTSRKVAGSIHDGVIGIFYIDIFVNCNWVVSRWQYTFTHKQYVEQHK